MNSYDNNKRGPEDSAEEERCPFCRAEWRVILDHRKLLSRRTGREVGMKEAVADWLKCFSREWRQERIMRALQDEREEILRHKWLESEKAGYDIGKDAVIDWILKHAARWRDWWEHHTHPSHPEKRGPD